MNSFDLITIGNATIDAFMTIQDANLHCRIDEKQCELCIRYGEKIMVNSCVFQMGGNAANVAVGLSRLHLKSSLVAEIGDDEFAQKIIKSLAKEQVDTSFLLQTPGTESSFAVGINFKAERTLFVKHSKRVHNFQLDTLSSQWIYLTSLGDEWKHVYQNVAALVKEKNIKLAFAPGTHQLEEGAENFLDVLRTTESLFVNLQEAQKVLSIQNQVLSIKELLLGLQRLGPKIVVITDGGNGSSAIDKEGKIYQLGIIDAPIVERTGAGDAYASGFLAAIVSGESVQEAMRWGTLNAAAVIGKVGAEAGLLSKEAIQEKLVKQKNFQPQTIG